MKLKLTVTMKNGCKVKVIKKVSDPPKGTDLDTHYMLEAVDMADKIQQNGLCLTIPPTQIGDIVIQPKKENGDGPIRITSEGRPVVQGARLQPTSQG
jgi:hypothetical protein